MSQLIMGLILFLVIWGIIAIMYKSLNLSKRGISLKPFIFIARSKSIASKLEKVGLSISKPWSICMNIGVVIVGALMVYAFYILASNLMVIATDAAQAGLYVIIPGLTIGWHAAPYFLLAAAITIVVHEVFHAITFGSERVPIKSFGIFLAVVLPGGFVEASEEAFKARKALPKMRIYASGSFSNFMVFLLATAIMVLTISPTPSGVLILNTIEGYPAHEVLKSWDVIVSINSLNIHNRTDLDRVLSSIPPGSNISVSVLRGDKIITTFLVTASNPIDETKSFMGVEILDYHPSSIPWLKGEVYWHWILSLDWLRLISISVAMINMLPIPLLDGSGFMRAIIEGLLKDKKRLNDILMSILSSISLFLLLANIMIPMIRP